MKHIGIAVAFSLLAFAAPALAQETFSDMEYISGHAGLSDKVKGRLEVGDSAIRFLDKHDREVFSIPIATITEVTNSVEENVGSTGRKLLLGAFASRSEEFLYITTESDAGAEGLVFKCKRKTSPGIVAKIKFQVKRYQEAHAAAQ
jgi:hypothetical protein